MKHITKTTLALVAGAVATTNAQVANLPSGVIDVIADANTNNGALTGVTFDQTYGVYIVRDQATWATGQYVVSKPIFVFDSNGGQPAELTIEPGSIVFNTGAAASPTMGDDSYGALIVSRNGKLFAEGTADAPIYFSTSRFLESMRNVDIDGDGVTTAPTLNTRGQWGGIILLGDDFVANYSTSVTIGGVAQSKPQNINVIEGFLPSVAFNQDQDGDGLNDLLTYGNAAGTDNKAHSAGSLKYVSISHGGIDLGGGNEINGLTLAGVGAGTELFAIEVLSNADDGIEFFGGSANLRGGFVAYQKDDALDLDEGYSGNIQYFANIQDPGTTGSATDSDHGGEWDGNSGGTAANKRSMPIISNVTLIGDNDGDPAIKFDDFFGGYLANAVITNFADLVEVTADYAPDAYNVGRNFFSVYTDVTDNSENINESFFASQMTQNSNLGLGVIDLDNNKADPVPTATSSILKANGAPVLDLAADYGLDYFWATDHLGAFPQGYNWLKGWAVADVIYGMFD